MENQIEQSNFEICLRQDYLITHVNIISLDDNNVYIIILDVRRYF